MAPYCKRKQKTHQSRSSNSIKTNEKLKVKTKKRFKNQKQTKRKSRRNSSTCTRYIKKIGPTDRNLFCTFDFQGYSSTKSIDRLGRFLPVMQSIMAEGEFVHVVTGWAGHNSLGNFLRAEGFSFEEHIPGLLKVHRQ